MSRTKIVSWVYECDAAAGVADPDGLPCQASKEIGLGDSYETGRGTVIHDQADADAAARTEGWSVGRHVLCPTHAGGGA